MKTFLQRLFGGATGSVAANTVTPATASKADEAAARMPDAAPAKTDTIARKAQVSAALLGVSTRRPLISTGGDVAGFEFRISEDILRRLRHAREHKAQAAYVLAVQTSARLVQQSGRVGFVRLPTDWFIHAMGNNEDAGIFVGLEPPSNDKPEPGYLQAVAQAIVRMRAAGAKVGWDASSATMGRSVTGMTPDFLLLPQGAEPMTSRVEAIKNLPAAQAGQPIFATDITSVEDLEEALHRGVRYVCGELAPMGTVVNARELRPVPPEVRRIGHLLKQLVTGAETAVIAEEIKGDVGLSFRLLRLINSASFAQLHAGASIEQAVMVLGRNELYRWLSIMMMQYAGQRKVSSALQEVALWRSRLLELLAIERKEEAPGQFFTLGLASMLGFILKVDLPEVIDTLNLPEPARQALLEQSGPWHDYLRFSSLLETQSLDQAGELAEPFGGIERIAAMSDAAWIWAAEHADRKGGRWENQGE